MREPPLSRPADGRLLGPGAIRPLSSIMPVSSTPSSPTQPRPSPPTGPTSRTTAAYEHCALCLPQLPVVLSVAAQRPGVVGRMRRLSPVPVRDDQARLPVTTVNRRLRDLSAPSSSWPTRTASGRHGPCRRRSRMCRCSPHPRTVHGPRRVARDARGHQCATAAQGAARCGAIAPAARFGLAPQRGRAARHR